GQGGVIGAGVLAAQRQLEAALAVEVAVAGAAVAAGAGQDGHDVGAEGNGLVGARRGGGAAQGGQSGGGGGAGRRGAGGGGRGREGGSVANRVYDTDPGGRAGTGKCEKWRRTGSRRRSQSALGPARRPCYTPARPRHQRDRACAAPPPPSPAPCCCSPPDRP